MNFDEAKQTINQMIDENYKDFKTDLVSIEKESTINKPWILCSKTHGK